MEEIDIENTRIVSLIASLNKRPIGLGILVVVLALNYFKWPWHVKSEKYQHVSSIHTWGPNFCLFCSTMSIFLVTPFFRKSALNDPKRPYHVPGKKKHTCYIHHQGPNFRPCQGQKYQHACYIHPGGHNFHLFRTTMSRLWVTAQFLEKVNSRLVY